MIYCFGVFTLRIKDLREDKKFFQKDLANLLCISQAQYSRIELGIYELSYDGLIKLSLLYNTSIDYILGLTDVVEPYPRSKKKRGF